jgi:hypothetical protein
MPSFGSTVRAYPVGGTRRPVHRLLVLPALVALFASAALPAPAAAAEPTAKVAVIVGPVGEELTPVYIGLADAAAEAAETRGAAVSRAYSPEATAEHVLEAVEGANIVVYFGHGVGSPNPYSEQPNPETTNGWGLNGPRAEGHADSWRDGTLRYYGEAWIAANARPAPGWVMIYSNACYAPGAGEGFDEPATEKVAAGRVSAYSRGPLAELGASAYFATDFYQGASHLIAALLDSPTTPYGDIFGAVPNYDDTAVARLAHESVEGAETWLHHSAYFSDQLDYWYAFAGDPSATFAGGAAEIALAASGVSGVEPAVPSLTVVDGRIRGVASHYGETARWKGQATVALPIELGGAAPSGEPTMVVVCAERCVTMPVVDSCPCYVGTPDQRVANLSHAAWAAITDAPLAEGLIEVEVHISPIAPPLLPGSPSD